MLFCPVKPVVIYAYLSTYKACDQRGLNFQKQPEVSRKSFKHAHVAWLLFWPRPYCFDLQTAWRADFQAIAPGEAQSHAWRITRLSTQVPRTLHLDPFRQPRYWSGNKSGASNLCIVGFASSVYICIDTFLSVGRRAQMWTVNHQPVEMHQHFLGGIGHDNRQSIWSIGEFLGINEKRFRIVTSFVPLS